MSLREASVTLQETPRTQTGKHVMIQHDNSTPIARLALAPRRLALLASVVGLGIAVLVAGPGPNGLSGPAALISAAQADTATAHPAGFADLVEKVKPVVVSVRVSLDASAKTATLNQDNDSLQPFRQGSPFDRFFRQFGQQDLPNGPPQTRQRAAAEGSGFFISA